MPGELNVEAVAGHVGDDSADAGPAVEPRAENGEERRLRARGVAEVEHREHREEDVAAWRSLSRVTGVITSSKIRLGMCRTRS
jgi:hypothetical protein